MKRVTVLFVEGGLASCAIAPMDVFRSAGTTWNQIRGDQVEPVFDVTTASADGKITRCHDGTRIIADRSIRQVRNTDLILVPSIGLELDEGLARNAELLRWIKRQHAGGAEVASICSGVSLLAEAGILNDKPATTHWGLAELYKERYPDVRWQPELLITDADGVYCCGGVYAALDLSLYLVERYAGRTVATQCAKALLMEAPRSSQSGFAVDLKRRIHTDEKVHRIQKWLQKNYQTDFCFDDVAAREGMSPRNFARRFKQATGEKPLAYLHRLRVEAAKELLEQDYATIQTVASDVGYFDVAHFRDLFKRHTGISPNAYRQRFGGH